MDKGELLFSFTGADVLPPKEMGGPAADHPSRKTKYRVVWVEKQNRLASEVEIPDSLGQLHWEPCNPANGHEQAGQAAVNLSIRNMIALKLATN